MRAQSYGEIAFNAWKALRNDSVNAVWDNQSEHTQDVWENIAACVITQHLKHQLELGRQTIPEPPTQSL